MLYNFYDKGVAMVGYDFDKTIYNGDSFIDFYLFVLLRFPYLIIILPFQLIAMAFVCGDKKRIKEIFAFYLRLVPNKERLVVRFWKKNVRKLKYGLIKDVCTDDVVISASPKFIVNVAVKATGVQNCIATNMDIKSGRIVGKNCYGKVKLERFGQDFPNIKLDAFYSDSLSDLPMKAVSRDFYLVSGENVEKCKID